MSEIGKESVTQPRSPLIACPGWQNRGFGECNAAKWHFLLQSRYSPALQPMVVIVVMAAFAPFRSNRMGFLHLLPLALVESLAVLGKIEAQVAVVAPH